MSRQGQIAKEAMQYEIIRLIDDKRKENRDDEGKMLFYRNSGSKWNIYQ